METENAPQEVVLTDTEQKQLEEYKGDNSFLKSLSEKYKEYGKLTERQILAFRNQEYYDENTGEPKQGLKLQDWFTRNDDFWKESRPMQSSSPKPEPVQAPDSQTSSVEVTPEISSDENAEDDGLPF